MAGRNHYEAQQGSGALVHSMARLVCIEKGLACTGLGSANGLIAAAARPGLVVASRCG